ncbi:MAG TPA: DegV family protein [Verrucomicrobiae bacterium]|nr:DegV family protein [Verrucomicrobiae bacterium]
MGVTIVTDSTCDLGSAAVRDLGVVVAPIWIIFGQERLRDGVDITRTNFNARLVTAKDFPRTEPPEAAVFEALFAKAVEAGNEVVAPIVSSGLSKTYANASEAAVKFGGKVRVVDTQTLSGGQLLQVQVAGEMARAGASAADIAEKLEAARAKQHGYLITPDLTYLGRSGRINKAIVALGTVLKVNPVLQTKNGLVETAAQTRTYEKAQELMIEVAARHVEEATKTRFAVGHIEAPELAEHIVSLLKTKLGFPPKSLVVYEGGPTLSVNGGPGSLAIFFIAGV